MAVCVGATPSGAIPLRFIVPCDALQIPTASLANFTGGLSQSSEPTRPTRLRLWGIHPPPADSPRSYQQPVIMSARDAWAAPHLTPSAGRPCTQRGRFPPRTAHSEQPAQFDNSAWVLQLFTPRSRFGHRLPKLLCSRLSLGFVASRVGSRSNPPRALPTLPVGCRCAPNPPYQPASGFGATIRLWPMSANRSLQPARRDHTNSR